MYYITVIETNGRVRKLDPQAGVPDYTQLQELVGGMIQLVPYYDYYAGKPCVAFCDEEGKLKGLEFNAAATISWAKRFVRAVGYPMRGTIQGPLVVVAADTAQELQEL